MIYHYASRDGWAEIQDSGQLEPLSHQTSSLDNLPLLWLTDRPDGGGTGVDPQRLHVRISVHPEYGVHPWLIARFEASTEGRNLNTPGSDPDSWFVTTRPVPRERWLTAVDHATGEVLWRNESPPAPPEIPEGWTLTDSDIEEFADFFREKVNDPSVVPLDGRFEYWPILVGPRLDARLNALRSSRDNTTETGRYRTWLCWRALCEDAARLPGFPEKWRHA
ncbi:hypothetical protein [Kitasatospora brasiliensis]|uniref:hypothetical protein n=1 Tax=Kitasatospora brasiliensis TaxID=3058040 RepID=UPI00292FF485|nr:hypothetical protein [Kitasatospora sp. K002]